MLGRDTRVVHDFVNRTPMAVFCNLRMGGARIVSSFFSSLHEMCIFGKRHPQSEGNIMSFVTMHILFSSALLASLVLGSMSTALHSQYLREVPRDI